MQGITQMNLLQQLEVTGVLIFFNWRVWTNRQCEWEIATLIIIIMMIDPRDFLRVKKQRRKCVMCLWLQIAAKIFTE